MKLIPCFLVSCLIATHALAADGWENLRWGASKKQVMEAYPKAVDQGGNAGDLLTNLQLKGHPMAGYDFTVVFFIDKQQRLQAVSMFQDSDPAPVDRRLEDIERALTERYGKPTVDTSDVVKKWTWTDDKGTISLREPGFKERMVTLHYLSNHKPEKTPAEKN